MNSWIQQFSLIGARKIKGKVGYDSLIWKNIEKITSNFINQFYLHSFKNILKYMYFFISQIIIFWKDSFTCYVNNTN